MNHDLMLAVLSMDAYNRGYGAGIGLAGNTIGSAQITKTTLESDTDAVRAGFSATAYQWNGETIISYRGTDGNFFTDAWYAYGTGAGNNSTQADLAAQFYQAVKGATGAVNPVLTGHSLGGGLAGLLGSLYGKEAVVFDNMAYQAATDYIHWNATHPYRTIPIAGGENPFHEHALNTYYPGVGSGGSVPLPNISGVSGFQLNGQLLQGSQSTGTVVGSGYSWGLGPLGLHSMSLLVISMFAEQQVGNHDWWSISALIGPRLSDSDIAANAGMSSGEAMQTMIAYSVVNEGERRCGCAFPI